MLLLISFLFLITLSISVVYLSKLKLLVSPAAIFCTLSIFHVIIPAIFIQLGILKTYPWNVYYLDDAIIFCFLCVLSYMFGFLMALRRYPGNHNFTKRFPNWKLNRVFLFAMGIMIIGIWARYQIVIGGGYFQVFRGGNNLMDSDSGVYSWLYQLENFPLIALLIILSWRFSHGYKTFGLFTIVLWTIEIIYWLPTGKKEAIILALALPYVCYYFVTRNLPSRKKVVAVGLFVILLFPLISVYRGSMENLDPSGTLIDVYDASMTQEVAENRGTFESVINRLSFIETTAAAIRLIDTGNYHLKFMENYVSGVLGLIPRFIWPDKPELSYGNQFGFDAGFLTRKDLYTSVSATYFGESFLNFSWFGFIPFFFVGFIFHVFYAICSSKMSIQSGAFLYCSLISNILYLGGTFAVYFPGAIKSLIIYGLVVYGLSVKLIFKNSRPI